MPARAAGAAGCVLRAIRDGRPAQIGSPSASVTDDDELEDIGAAATPGLQTGAMDERVRKAYLSEIILQLGDMKRQIDRARAGASSARSAFAGIRARRGENFWNLPNSVTMLRIAVVPVLFLIPTEWGLTRTCLLYTSPSPRDS